ncbi:MAG TPA: hypothetical protein VFN21_13510 [Acidimicrobiales bacterium]|nr:hypothetical protein [Acidimicrobiales bacterium]
MTEHDASADTPHDPVQTAVDRRLATAMQRARNATRPPDRHAFLARARNRRDRLRRRRRTLTVATPIAAAAVVLVAIGVIATGGDHPSMQASTGGANVTRAEPAVDADTPIRVTPDHGLVDGQTVHVAAYGAAQVMFSQCAVVRTVDGTLFYACTNDPAEHAWNVLGAVPVGSTDNTLIAQDSFTVHDQLRGRLYLLAYPSGTITSLTAEASDVSCKAATMPIVTPVPAGTGTDTMAPTTAVGPLQTTTVEPSPDGSTDPKSRAGSEPAQPGCVVMVSGVFRWILFDTPPTAPISFGDTATVGFHGDLADVQITPSDDSMTVRVRPSGSKSYGEPRRIDTPNHSDAWVDNPIGMRDVTVHVIALAEGSSLVDPHDAAELAVGTASCGRFECLVYEVPRDHQGPTPTLTIASRGRTSSVVLDSVPVGAGVLRGHFGG